MITIDVKPAKRRFSRRKQWKFTVTAGNNEQVDPRDTYANVGDIRDIWDRIINGSELVRLVVHYTTGPQVSYLRKRNTGRDFQQ